MKEIETLYDKVERILIEQPKTRDSDAELYIALCLEINGEALNRPFKEVMLHRKAYGLPNEKSVERVRRKVQEKNFHLRSTKAVEDARYENFKFVREWSQSE